LFARLRGVPEKDVKGIVDGTMELTPHRHKLSMRLSGEMKRKLWWPSRSSATPRWCCWTSPRPVWTP
jgi:hypothetical protein